MKKLLMFVLLFFWSLPAFAFEPLFDARIDYGVGSWPQSVFCADLDGDADLDLAVANIVDDNVSILKNNGDGTFQTKVDFGAGDGPRSVFCADLDGDNDLDLVVSNYYSDNVSILKNNGDGTFQSAVSYGTGDGPYGVFCADLDGDTDVDLAVANYQSTIVSILKNNGNGTFQSAVNYGVGSSPTSVFCADLDGDNDLDLVVSNYYSDNVSILKNNGNGTFQSAVNYGAGHDPHSLFCADLDGDTDLDLAVANVNSDNVSILKNNGDGTFQSAVNYWAGDYPYSVFCGDLDGDTDLDLVVAIGNSDNVSILKNNGDGTYQTAVNYGAGHVPVSVFCADLDGDTDLDLAVVNTQSYTVSILRNNGDGTFPSEVKYSVGGNPSSVFCADLDGDTDLDLAVVIRGSFVSILKNNGDGTFQTKVDYGAGNGAFSVYSADLDGDTDLDLAVANDWSHSVSILKNNGDGTFQSAVNYGVGDGPLSVFCADLDGDGDLDLSTANRNSDNVSILKNNSDGTYQTAVNYGTGYDPFSVFCADLDGDTDLDLAVANLGNDNVSVLKNNGDGTYQTAVNYGVGDAPYSVFCVDLDGDADQDMAVANDGSRNVSILKNNGDGTFQSAVNYEAGNSPYSVFCADLDGDPDLDLAVANMYTDNVSILKNNGDGTFQSAVNYGAGSRPQSLFCADLDGDADLDMAVANYDSKVCILRNLSDMASSPPSIQSIRPEKSANVDRVYVTITGLNCWSGAGVKLARSGFPTDTILATEVTVYPFTKIIARFDLAGQSTGTMWDLIVTNPNGGSDTLFSAFGVVSPPELFTEDILCVLSSNHQRIQDFQANAKAWSRFNGEPLDSIIHSRSLYKSPDKVKNIDYANEDSTQIISTVISRGWLQYEVDADSGYAYETNLLQVAQMTPSEFSGLNFYDPDDFLFHHYVSIKEIHEYPDSLIFVLEAIPKRVEWTYSKLELEIEYSKGLAIRSTIYSDTVNLQTVTVTEEQLIDGIWVGTKSITTTADTSETLETQVELSNIQINVGIPDSVFYPTKIKQMELEPETTYQEIEMPSLPKNISAEWDNPIAYKPNPILFLHGFASGKPDDWENTMQKFREYMDPYYAGNVSWYAHCPDFRTFPGANGSIDGTNGWGDATCAQIESTLNKFDAISEEYQPQKVNVVAHSMGGLGSRECVTYYPNSYQLVDKIITTGTPHLGSTWAQIANGVVVSEKTFGSALGFSPMGWISVPTKGIILICKFWQKIDVDGEAVNDMTPGSTFFNNLYARDQYEDEIRYFAIAGILDGSSAPIFGPDDGVVSRKSQLGIGESGGHDFYQYLQKPNGTAEIKSSHGDEPTKSFVPILKFLDSSPNVVITSPQPNDELAEACTLRIELHSEYLPATTQLEVKMIKVGASEPIFSDAGNLFEPDTSWRAVGPNSIKSGRYNTTIPLSKAPPGKYRITAKVKNPANFEDEASVEIILGVDLMTQIGGGQARRGFNKNYGINYSNIGNAKASNITVEETLPPQVYYVSSSPPGNLSGNKVQWDFDSLAAGESGNVSVTVYIPGPTPQGTILHATSNISTTDDDVDLTNNPSEVSDPVVGSWDPNDKMVQPTGKGDKGYIAEGQILHYTIFFENDTTATAEAINIVVVDTLDPNLNWNSLRFGPMSHPDKCSTSFDPVTGVITLECDSIMLPPDTLPPTGEGWFTFSIAPQYLQHGSQIKNRASIQFDFNPWMYAPMDSSYIINTMDEYPPNSRVTPLWDTVVSLDFEVNWRGSDDSLGFGCGIKDYIVYVSDNGEPYQIWIADTSDTFATFHGQLAHTYCFYSIAEDSLGNIEDAPLTPDACTRTPTPPYLRGDANGDGVINVSDVVYLINYLFINGPAPVPLEAGDVNCDGTINVADVVYLINYLFISGPPPGC